MRWLRNHSKNIRPHQRKNISQSGQSARARSVPIPSTVAIASIKPCLHALLSAHEVSDPVAREAESNIKRIADVQGLYLAASSVHSYVEAFVPTTDGEKNDHRPRGFELAGELYYHHLHAEVNSIGEKNGIIGPRVFGNYCTELFDCFLAGEHVRKGVGYPIMLMETLLSKAVTSTDKKSLYLALADQAMQSMAELSTRKFTEDTADTLNEARKEKKDNFAESETKNPHKVIDQKLFDHLQHVQKGYALVRGGLEKAKVPRTALDEASEVRNYRAYFEELLSATTQGYYLGLTGMMKEMMGRYLHRARDKEYGRYVLAAAQDLENLADKEHDLYLVVMSAKHYRKAHELYSFVGDREKAAAASGKLAKLKSDYDPQMLTISQL